MSVKDGDLQQLLKHTEETDDDDDDVKLGCFMVERELKKKGK